MPTGLGTIGLVMLHWLGIIFLAVLSYSTPYFVPGVILMLGSWFLVWNMLKVWRHRLANELMFRVHHSILSSLVRTIYHPLDTPQPADITVYGDTDDEVDAAMGKVLELEEMFRDKHGRRPPIVGSGRKYED